VSSSFEEVIRRILRVKIYAVTFYIINLNHLILELEIVEHIISAFSSGKGKWGIGLAKLSVASLASKARRPCWS
jgi:hypothetical protein